MNKLKMLALAGFLAISGVAYASSPVMIFSCGKKDCTKCTKECSAKEKSAAKTTKAAAKPAAKPAAKAPVKKA